MVAVENGNRFGWRGRPAKAADASSASSGAPLAPSAEAHVGTHAEDVAPAPAMLEVSGLAFSYGDAPVLSGIDLRVSRGTCTCLMGVNGCGKSTLIDCVLGENRPASGQVLIDGRPTAQLRPRQMAQLASYVPQVHERSFPYTVEQIVAMGLAADAGWGAPDAEGMARVDEALAGCGIAHLAQRPYTALSGGQMQMTLLARALVQDAPLVLMDEPTAHLDFRNELVFLETVERLVLERGVTVLMATHAPNQAFHLAAAGVSTRVAVMDGGRVVAEGAPRQVLTEEMLASVFGIEARLVEASGRDEGERTLRQIVPVRSMAPTGTMGKTRDVATTAASRVQKGDCDER